MIGQNHRFHGLGSLRSVYQHGKTVRASALALRFMRNDRRQTYRLAVVVSKKVHKSAVTRNRVRRRIYEIIRHQEAHITSPYDLVLTVFSEEVVDLPPEKLQNLVLSLLQQADVLS